ncbi:MAG: Nicotinamide-nucleotide amidohydrolase PncC [Myxococcota bacterium]|nr:Nicotinamide-nucleotide amidohydrolase PncC [Myxococcota bacterium]
MRIEHLSTGDEVLNGSCTDTNTVFFANQLFESGLEASALHTVGDNRDELKAMLRDITARADVLVMSGGLGATSDDLTSEVVAGAAGVPLDYHEDIWLWIQELFRSRGFTAPEINRKQAILPRGCEVLPNRAGTAPAFRLTVGRCEVFALPGVPREYQLFMQERVLPFIRERSGRGQVVCRTLRVYGFGESHLASILGDLENEYADRVTVGYRASHPEVWVKLVSRGGDRAAVDDMAAKAREKLGLAVFGEDSQTLGAVVSELLKQQGETIAVAESCTGGMAAAELTERPGSSACFVGGFVVYSNALKTALLGVPEAVLAAHGAVSQETAEIMAREGRSRTGAGICLAITGIAGPDGGTPEKPVGTVHFALATATEIFHRKEVFSLGGGRPQVRRTSVYQALNMARLYLQGHDPCWRHALGARRQKP